jgi:DNA-binding response OmpR family regulator
MFLRKIIYVDDVNYSLLSLKEKLKDYYDVYTAQSVERLFEILAAVMPDLILLDVKMPGIDGFKAIQMLKADKRYSGIPIIFLTAQNDKDSVFMGLNLGAAAYVSKPYATNNLVETIESVFFPKIQKNPFEEFIKTEEETDKPCILAVDDVPMMLRTIQSALQDKYKVYALSKPEEISNLLKRIRPDLFLLDYKMPGLTGFDVVPIIRSFIAHKTTPIIFVTGVGTIDNMVMAAGLGACDFIVKPISVEALRAKVKKHIRKTW